MIEFEEFLLVKYLVENQKAEYEWIITNVGVGTQQFTLEDGCQKCYRIFGFNEEEYNAEEVKIIGRQLAKELGISCTL